MESAECEIDPVLSSEESILKKIDEYYKSDISLGNISTELHSGYNWQEELHKEDLSDNHIQKIIKAILKQAIIEEIHEVIFQCDDEAARSIF